MGIAIARSRVYLLPKINQPVWYAVHGIAGIFFASMGYNAREMSTRGVSNVWYGGENSKILIEKASYAPQVGREFLVRYLNVSEVMLLACNGMLNLSPEVLAMVRDRELDADEETAARTRNVNKTTVEVLMMPPNDSNGPHMTETPVGEMEPVQYAMRNYDWTPDQIGAIAQLGTHLRKLRELRQISCDDAEAIWQWLTLSECEYYSRKAIYSDAGELKSIKKYLTMPRQRHALVWIQVSEWDWIIADTQKQLDLARSADFTQEPREIAKLVSHTSAESKRTKAYAHAPRS